MEIKRFFKRIPLIRDYVAFRKINKATNPSFFLFLKSQIWINFKNNRYFPYDKNTTIMGRNIILGKNSVIGQRGGCYIQGNGKLFIGDYVRIAQNVIITSDNHDPLNHKLKIKKETIIGDYCWIASNACIMAGVVLGPRTIVGAGSVVTKSFPEGFCIIAGNPARLIRNIDRELFIIPEKEPVEFYGYIRSDRFPEYYKKYLSYLQFDYNLSAVTYNPIFVNNQRVNDCKES